MSDDLRKRYAEAIRAAAEYAILGEWICCDPVNPEHDLCVKGDIARQMLRAVLADDPEALFVPSGVLDALMAVRDEELSELREQVAFQKHRADTYLADYNFLDLQFKALTKRVANAGDRP
ncbi:hypothetical protein ABZ917_17520 [Nonomuraea wenchangensis]